MDHYRVILIHSFFRKNSNMKYLSTILKKSGFRVDILKLPLTFFSISVNENLVKKKINEILRDKQSEKQELIFIGYGLGGVVLRYLLSQGFFKNIFSKIILIASPGRTPTLVKKFPTSFMLLSKIFKSWEALKEGKLENLEIPHKIDLGIIRGTEPNFKLFSKYLSEYNDGFLDSSDTLSGKESEILDIPFCSLEILQRPGTAEYIMDFIETGKFIKKIL